jgi:hypothetical protein
MSFRDYVTYLDEDAHYSEEIWKDEDGTLYVPAFEHAEGWYAFGTDQVIHEDNPLVRLPMFRVFDNEGNFVLGGPLRGRP